jgi:hypothetical protein
MRKPDVLLSTPVPPGQTKAVYEVGLARAEAVRPIPVGVVDTDQDRPEEAGGEAPPLGFTDLLRLVRPECGRLIVSGLRTIVSVVLGLVPFVLIYRLTLDLLPITPGRGWAIWPTARNRHARNCDVHWKTWNAFQARFLAS